MAGSITLEHWISFFTARIDAWDKQVNLIISAAGIIPAGVFTGVLDLVSDPVHGLLVAVGVAAMLIGAMYFLAVTLSKRRYVIALHELILAGVLRTPADVALAYAVVFHSQ